MYHAYLGFNTRGADISRMLVCTLTAAITQGWIQRLVFPFAER